jgi:hypothetical protein
VQEYIIVLQRENWWQQLSTQLYHFFTTNNAAVHLPLIIPAAQHSNPANSAAPLSHSQLCTRAAARHSPNQQCSCAVIPFSPSQQCNRTAFSLFSTHYSSRAAFFLASLQRCRCSRPRQHHHPPLYQPAAQFYRCTIIFSQPAMQQKCHNDIVCNKLN